jgi:hypothetical protein
MLVALWSLYLDIVDKSLDEEKKYVKKTDAPVFIYEQFFSVLISSRSLFINHRKFVQGAQHSRNF